MRITKTQLESKLKLINIRLKHLEKPLYNMNYSVDYGGYQLTTNNGSHIVKHRIPPKQMNKFLEGVLHGTEFLLKE